MALFLTMVKPSPGYTIRDGIFILFLFFIIVKPSPGYTIRDGIVIVTASYMIMIYPEKVLILCLIISSPLMLTIGFKLDFTLNLTFNFLQIVQRKLCLLFIE